ncbi:sirohydrochlorin chelatase [Nocardioides marinquilinus]|uniref:Sirohydrochlorin chelatase n=1 Tax=Nocardioides marinquilinus TaxID=1210400 RepID=A0ABP9PUN5_9ACTN
MSAPALIALAPASRDPRIARTLTALVSEVRAQRPDLRVERALLDPAATGARWARPELHSVLDRLVRGGHDEVVVVPIALVTSSEDDHHLAEAARVAAERHPGLRVRIAASIGLEACLLEALDERLREALRDARVRELDALVLAAPGSTDPLANQSVARLARLWGTHHRLPVSAAYAAGAPPATGEAVRAFRAEGRRHVAVASLFLTPGALTDRAAELAEEAGAVAVSGPLAAHPEVARVVLARYAVGAVELVPV